LSVGRNLPGMIHPASHCPLIVISRADGRSSVAAAAYALRTRMTDHRVGKVHDYSSLRGLLAHGLVNWKGSVEELWNAAETREKRCNARVARELRPALPAELPPDEQRRLVHGFCCWLKDRLGVSSNWAIHAPEFKSKDDERRLWRDRDTKAGQKDYLQALYDPSMTNRNFHAHIRWTTRRVDAVSGEFGAKTRDLDDRTKGPAMVLEIRAEWERRTNAALKRVGSPARIDLRSYKTMAADGVAPDGLHAQDHMGPRSTAKSRTAEKDVHLRIPISAINRDERKKRNDETWAIWLKIRALEREKARLERSPEIAREREIERREKAKQDKMRIAQAVTDKEQYAAVAATNSIELPRSKDPLQAALKWARSGDKSPDQVSEFDRDIDPENFVSAQSTEPRKSPIRVRVRGRGQRTRE